MLFDKEFRGKYNIKPHEFAMLDNEFLKNERVNQLLQYHLKKGYEKHLQKVKFEAFKAVTDELTTMGYTANDIWKCNDNPELKKIIWSLVEKHIELFAKIPMNELKQIFGEVNNDIMQNELDIDLV